MDDETGPHSDEDWSDDEEWAEPTAADIIAHCDASGNGMLDQEEVHACIDEMVSSAAEPMHEAIHDNWEWIAGEDGEVDEAELEAIMGHPHNEGEAALAQLKKKHHH